MTRVFRKLLLTAIFGLTLGTTFSCLRAQDKNGSTPSSPVSRENEPDAIKYARTESALYRSRGMLNNWVYWFLSIAATGTAISTAVRTAYSPSRDPGKDANGQGLPPKSLDIVLLYLAVSTVVATTALNTINPKELATRYTFGQLTLEKALFQYDSILGTIKQADVDKVTEAYFQAEDVLENGLQAFTKQPPAKAEVTPAQSSPANADAATSTTVKQENKPPENH